MIDTKQTTQKLKSALAIQYPSSYPTHMYTYRYSSVTWAS